MIKKISLFVLFIAVIASSCNLGNRYKTENPADNQKAKVKEVIQTSNYTYLRVDKNNQEQWIAVGKMDVKEGDVVYFEKGMEMTNFKSPELGRTFESVLFVGEISDKPIVQESMPGGMPEGMEGGSNTPELHGNQPEKPTIEKLDVKVDQPAGGTTIATLYAKKSEFAGKLVTVRGKVTKVNAGIMGRNWIHIQDGTSDGDKFDLTVTTQDEPAVGAIVTYSGTFSIDKDFGYGYSYEILVENAEVVKTM
jgi:hypothetical protein